MIVSTKNLGMVDSLDLAEYIIFYCGKMSHLKLQKLLYYVQAYHLAYFESPIIEDSFQAWVHGPVSRKIYDTLKDKSLLYTEVGIELNEGEPNPDVKLRERITTEQYEWINDILKEFSPMSGIQLEALSHDEAPWILARKGYGPADRCEQVITEESMKEYYRQQLYTDEQA